MLGHVAVEKKITRTERFRRNETEKRSEMTLHDHAGQRSDVVIYL